jgi:uncharacterized RDD family membrane protein YckC
MPNGAITDGWTNFSADEEPPPPSRPVAEDAAEAAPSPLDATPTFIANPTPSPDAGYNSNRTSEPTSDSWRAEVAASLERYRTRRKPRTPRYPSLLLPFDAPESWSRSTPTQRETTGAPVVQNFAVQTNLAESPQSSLRDNGAFPAAESERNAVQGREPSPVLSEEPSSNVIEFPRSAALPVLHVSDLADPVFDHSRPRIVEAPEMLPPPPALGGMLIEPSAQEVANKRAQSTALSLSTSASIRKRALAALVDGIILTATLSAFAAIFLRLNPALMPTLHPNLTALRASLPLLIGAIGVVAALFWVAYEFLFVVYTGSTPGLRAARLRLAAFDGSPLNQSARRRRVLASLLSALSAGLGYFWCVLDQNGLCWHDRITRTHLEPASPKK